MRPNPFCRPAMSEAVHPPDSKGRVEWWRGEDSNLRSHKATDLQSAAFDRSATSPFKSRLQPAVSTRVSNGAHTASYGAMSLVCRGHTTKREYVNSDNLSLDCALSALAVRKPSAARYLELAEGFEPPTG